MVKPEMSEEVAKPLDATNKQLLIRKYHRKFSLVPSTKMIDYDFCSLYCIFGCYEKLLLEQ
jgi:hypothetical protein